jgi:hypothetical protein
MGGVEHILMAIGCGISGVPHETKHVALRYIALRVK